jgi:hypothetical protein
MRWYMPHQRPALPNCQLMPFRGRISRSIFYPISRQSSVQDPRILVGEYPIRHRNGDLCLCSFVNFFTFSDRVDGGARGAHPPAQVTENYDARAKDLKTPQWQVGCDLDRSGAAGRV